MDSPDADYIWNSFQPMSSFKFRILIDNDSGEEVFRDIALAGTSDFETFYRKIIESFDFRGDQMASFYISNDSWDKGHEITLLDMRSGNDPEEPSIMKDTVLKDHVSAKGDRIVLVYDFLKMWCFMIECVDVMKTNLASPRVEFSAGTAPGEDSRDVGENPAEKFGAPAELGNDIDDIFSDDDGDPLDEDSFDVPEGLDEY